MAKLEKEDLHDIVDKLREALEEPVSREAERVAQNMVGRILNYEDADLRHRLEVAISKIVQNEVRKHIRVSLEWLP